MGSRLSGQWAAITGGSKGIGFAIAEGLLAAGANVVIAARSAEGLAAARDELIKNIGDGQQVETHVLDISDERSIDTFFDQLGADLPQLDVFVANAGAGSINPFLEITREQWDDVIGLNLTGNFLCVQKAARMMKEGTSTNRSIIVVSSIRAVGTRPGTLPYSVAKAGLNQLVRISAYELASEGIRVNALSPGITATPLTQANPDTFARMVATVPTGRAGSPADMAHAALYLADPAAAFVTGTNLVVDGGEGLW
jgi:3-oxoacyl-[acyl-carrier protein] reductase